MENVNFNNVIEEAINNSVEFLADYWHKTLNQRIEGADGQCGSYYEMADTAELEEALRSAEWHIAEDQSNVIPGTIAYEAAIPGYEGIIDLNELNDDELLIMSDPKHTGYVKPVIMKEAYKKVYVTTIIIGEDAGKTVVYTVFPGRVIAEPRVEKNKVGTTATVAKLKKLGFTHANIERVLGSRHRFVKFAEAKKEIEEAGSDVDKLQLAITNHAGTLDFEIEHLMHIMDDNNVAIKTSEELVQFPFPASNVPDIIALLRNVLKHMDFTEVSKYIYYGLM